MKQTNPDKISRSEQLLEELKELRGGTLIPMHHRIANDPALLQAFIHQYSDTNAVDVSIPRKYRELIVLAIGMATQAKTTVDVHAKLALQYGATVDEIGEVFRMVFFLCGLTTITPSLELFEEIGKD